MRSIGIDIHRDFMEVAIAEEGQLRGCPRVAMDPETLQLFAESLGAEDQVALEVSGNAWEVVRIIRPHVGRVVAREPDRHRDAPGAREDRPPRREGLGQAAGERATGDGLGPRRGDPGDEAAASAPKPARPHQIRG